MKIISANQLRPATEPRRAMPAVPSRGQNAKKTVAPAPRPSRLAAVAAGSAVSSPVVGLAFFLSRKPTASNESLHAKFRA